MINLFLKFILLTQYLDDIIFKDNKENVINTSNKYLQHPYV